MDFHHSSGPNQVINEEDSTSSTITTTITQTGTQSPSTNTIRLRLQKKASKTGRRVSWTNDTVDNEMLNKKKSKCCCVYHKPKNWDESSSEDENDDNDCLHCKGHKKSDFNSKRDEEKHKHPGNHNNQEVEYQEEDPAKNSSNAH